MEAGVCFVWLKVLLHCRAGGGGEKREGERARERERDQIKKKNASNAKLQRNIFLVMY